jgi:hypothetical protein
VSESANERRLELLVRFCQRTIVDKDWTGRSTRKCGKNAPYSQPDGLPLCGHHYRRFVEKRSKLDIMQLAAADSPHCGANSGG